MDCLFGVSNLAWPTGRDQDAFDVLRSCGVGAVELAPARAFPGWPKQPAEVGPYRSALCDAGIEVNALQGIVFGAEGVSLFASPGARQRLEVHLSLVARLAGSLGARACVFGAPSIRDPGPLAPERAHDIAVAFFRRVAPAFASEGCCLTFEPVAAGYGCRFVTTARAAAALVAAVDHPGLRLQVDTAAMFFAGEPPAVLDEVLPIAGHFHASETGLAVLGAGSVDHAGFGGRLRQSGYKGPRSIEMSQAADWRAGVTASITTFRRNYCELDRKR